MIWFGGLFAFAPDFLYRVRGRWFPITRETFNTGAFSTLQMLKVLWFVFNVAPLLALLSMT